jgi:predicted ribosomally synthesized peptide with nif11-like leader
MIGFVEKLESDATFQEEFETALASAEDPGPTEVIGFASAHGFAITEEDCRTLATPAEGELDDDALDAVAGGGWLQSGRKSFKKLVSTLNKARKAEEARMKSIRN